MESLIDTTEMFLKVVLELEESAHEARRSRIAQRLHQAASSASQTIARLQAAGMVTDETGDRTVGLTPKGRALALSVMRKHRVAECYLYEVIGLEWAYLHQEACRWEHVMGDATTERMSEVLGYPDRSPYGNPIPPAGQLDWHARDVVGPTQSLELVAFEDRGPTTLTLEWIGEGAQSDPVLLGHLERTGLRPGATLTAERRPTMIAVTVYPSAGTRAGAGSRARTGADADRAGSPSTPTRTELPREVTDQLYVR